MSIVGVGTDIEDVARFHPASVSERLIERVFTPAERAYCQSRREPWIHFAARFAAKEAAVKALSSILPNLMVSQVEVVPSPTGAPSIRLVAGLRSDLPTPLPPNIILHVSISHTASHATANVIVEAA